MPVINLNQMAPNDTSPSRRRSSVDDPTTVEFQSQPLKKYSSPIDSDDEGSDADEMTNEQERRSSLLTENTRRLLVLGSIRPSKTFYKDLPEGDVEYLMEYFRRMRQHNRTLTSDEINQELTKKLGEYKPKICPCFSSLDLRLLD